MWVYASFLHNGGYSRFTVGEQFSRHTTVHTLLGVDASLRPCALIPHKVDKVDNLARTEVFQVYISGM